MVERISIDDQSFYSGYANHIQRYEFAARYCTKGTVLDAGCGTGYGSDFLARRGGYDVVALDISEEALSEARKHYHRDNLRFVKADVERLSEAPGVPGSVDAVVNLENLEHLQKPQDFLRGARALLAEDGVIIVSSPNGDLTERDEKGEIKNVYHVREYNATELAEMLRVDFAEVELFGQWRTPESKMRVRIETEAFETLCEIYSSPSQRAWRVTKKLLGKKLAPPPQFTGLGTSYPWDFVVRPLAESPYPWAPEVLLAVAWTGPGRGALVGAGAGAGASHHA